MPGNTSRKDQSNPIQSFGKSIELKMGTKGPHFNLIVPIAIGKELFLNDTFCDSLVTNSQCVVVNTSYKVCSVDSNCLFTSVHV